MVAAAVTIKASVRAASCRTRGRRSRLPGGASSPASPEPLESPSSTGGYTLGDLYDHYKERSARASENVRYLAGAGIAVVWMLSRQSIDGLTSDLLRTLVLCVGALISDFAHYVVAAFMLRRLHSKYVNERKKRQHFITVPKSTNRPGAVLYWIKIALLVLAFVSLVINFVARRGAPQASRPVASAAPAVEPTAPMMCSEGDAAYGAARTETP
jgi:hypothetical protein